MNTDTTFFGILRFTLSEAYPHGSTIGGAFTCAGDRKPTRKYTKQ